MGLETKSKTIGRFEYRVTQLKLKKARSMFTRLIGMLGPALGELAAGGKPNLATAVQALSERMTDDNLTLVTETFGESTVIDAGDGKLPTLVPAFMETHFAGHFGEMFQWLAFCIEVNYADFFDVLSGLGAAVQPAEKAQ